MFVLRTGENRRTRRKTSRNKGENQQQTQPTCNAESGNRTRVKLVGGDTGIRSGREGHLGLYCHLKGKYHANLISFQNSKMFVC